MSRRSKRHRTKNYSRAQRDNVYISQTEGLLRPSFMKTPKFLPRGTWKEYKPKENVYAGDRRRWFPDREREMLRRSDGRFGEIRASEYNRKIRAWRLEFGPDPEKTIVCRRRAKRREALFRLGHVGSGKSVTKLRKRTKDSDIVCVRR